MKFNLMSENGMVRKYEQSTASATAEAIDIAQLIAKYGQVADFGIGEPIIKQNKMKQTAARKWW